MRYWALISIPITIALGVSCDKLWSSSIVDCGRPGFTCPPGYSPDMPLGDPDGGTPLTDGGTSDQGGPGTGDMGAITPATYTSVYTLNNVARTTLVGTSDGRVRTYSYNGTNGIGTVFGFVNELSEPTKVPVVGVWQGLVSSISGSQKFSIVALNTNQVYTHIDNNTGVLNSTNDVINALWVPRRNDNAGSALTSNFPFYLAANNGKVFEADVLLSTSISLSSFNEVDFAVTAKINTVAGLQAIGDAIISRACMPTCDDVWAAGDEGLIFGRNSSGWHPISLATGTLPLTASFLGIASARSTTSSFSVAAAVGKDGRYAEQQPLDGGTWQSPAPPQFGGVTMNAVCFFDNQEAWAVGEGGTVYHYINGNPGPWAWTQVNLPNLGKPLSSVSFRAVHCAEQLTGTSPERYRRVTIVGSNNTLIFADDASMMGFGYAWTRVE